MISSADRTSQSPSAFFSMPCEGIAVETSTDRDIIVHGTDSPINFAPWLKSKPRKVQEHYPHVPVKEWMESVTRTCARKSGASKDDIRELHDYKHLTPSREKKCFLACTIFTFGSMEQVDEKDNKEAVDLYIYAAFRNREERSKASEIWDFCYSNVTKGEDYCEYGYAMTACFLDAVNKANMKPLPFWTVN